VGVDQRAALLHVRAEHLAQRLVHEVRDRVVAHRALAQRRIDARIHPVAELQRAGLHRAVVAVDVGLDLLRVLDGERAGRADDFAAIADLAAAFARSRCCAMAASKPAMSIITPRSRQMSAVRSTGKPKVSYSRNTVSPSSSFSPDASADSSTPMPFSSVSAKRSSSCFRTAATRSCELRNSG